jgi:hypothetical protein
MIILGETIISEILGAWIAAGLISKPRRTRDA